MGFRSTIISEYYNGVLPNWFKERYSDRLLYPDGILIVSKTEWKYDSNNLFEDYRKALIEIGFFDSKNFTVGIAVMAEDQFISKVLIGNDDIKYIWMEDGSNHNNVWRQV